MQVSEFRKSPNFIKLTSAAIDGWKILHAESDRGSALVGGAILDEVLAAYLTGYLTGSTECLRDLMTMPNAPLSSFSAKINLCRGLGLISENTYRDMHVIRRIRNAAAHFEKKRGDGFHTGFVSAAVERQCRSLALPPEVYAGFPPRLAFEVLVGSIGSVFGERALILKFLADNEDKLARGVRVALACDLFGGERDDAAISKVMSRIAAGLSPARS